MVGALGRAQLDKFVDIVHDAAFAHDLQPDDAAAERADGQAIGLGVAKQIIGALTPAAAVHVFDDDGGITGDMFAQRGHH
jgi:hypothetical protein